MLITFEGGDQSGKTTQAFLLAKKIKNSIYIREPGFTTLGENVRDIIKNNDNIPITDTMLFLAARAQLIHEVIKPKLNDNHIIICDRFIDSTIAYQGYGHNINIKYLKKTNKLVTDNIIPDITFFIDVPPEIALTRDKPRDKIEDMPIEYHKKVYHGYHEIAKKEPSRWKIIDGNRNINEVAKDVWLAWLTYVHG